ncbi:TetR family transcriptional regulator [Pseudonocardia sp. NPDC049154]|uniref:TetR/AcrR family transcriptional regulator n=1 Tax=Pseudonocardia sp. NPDC049154 TaxID=3155501 RepID=UPI0033EB0473
MNSDDTVQPGGGRPRRERFKSARTRARILEAAATLLSERGYAATRIGDVAELAEMQGPALYYYFASRDELIEEVIATGQRGVVAHVTAALDGAAHDPLDRILAAVAAHLEYVLTTSAFASASIRNFAQLPEEVQQRQVRFRQAYGDIWRALFREAERVGDLDPVLDVHAARMLVIGALNWTCEWWDPGKGSLDDLVSAARRFVRDALTGRSVAAPAALTGGDRGPDEREGETERKSVRSRRRILAAAARVLSARGYSGTRLSDVAEAADMQAASIYYHFASRDELIEEVVRDGVRRTDAHVRAALGAMPPDASPLDRLDQAVTAHLSFCLSSPDVTVATIRNAGQLPADIARRQREAEAEYGAVWRELIAGVVNAGGPAAATDPRITRMLILGALNQTAEWSDRDRSPEPIVRTARAMVRNALGRGTAAAAPLAPLFRSPAAG